MAPPDPQSPIAIGIEWATRIMVAVVVSVLPLLAGVGVDRWLGSRPIGVLVGLALGGVVGLVQLIRLVNDLQRSTPGRGAR